MAETLVPEVVSAGAVEALNRSEIESQIEIAKRFPRSMEKFKTRAIEMATSDEETAASCIYRRPVGKDGGQQKYAEGMSIRTAEIVGASYGNLRVYATILSQTDRQVVARGMAIDLESNFASSSEVIEPTVDRNGNPYSERQRAVVAKAALAKARRDATFQVVPKALAKPVELAVRQLLLGDAKSMETRRTQVAGWVKTLGIEENRVWAALGVKGIADIGLKELETLTGLRTAIKDGDTTIDEAFPPVEIKTPQAKNKETHSADQHRGGESAQPQGTAGDTGTVQNGQPEADSRRSGDGTGNAGEGSEGSEKKATEPTQNSRSVKRRVAAMKGERPPEFGANDGDGNKTDRPDGGPAGVDRGDAAQSTGGVEGQAPAGEVDLAEDLLHWIETCPDEEIGARSNRVTDNFKKLAEHPRQMEVLRTYDDRRRALAAAEEASKQ